MNEQYGLAKLKTNTMSDINIFLVSKISTSEDYTPNIPNIDIKNTYINTLKIRIGRK